MSIANATISVSDATGAVVASAVSASDGSYQLQPVTSSVAPLVLIATAPSGLQLTSVVGSTAVPVVNITSLSNLVAALLSSTGTPVQLAQDIVAQPNAASPSAIAAKVSTVNAQLAPITAALGVSQTDFMNQPFIADGTGVDRLLDSLDIKVRPAGGVSNIQITLRQLLGDTENPLFLSFASNAASGATSYSVDASKLIPSGESAKFSAFLNGLQTCYATTPRTNGASVTAAACTSLFYNNDPTTYLNNSRVVGALGAWSGMFSSFDNGEQFSEGRYLYSHLVQLQSGGSVLAHVFGYFIRTTSGAVGWDVINLTEQNGNLVLIGDQHLYNSSITSYAQVRHFPNQPAADYYENGFSYNVSHAVNPNGTIRNSVDHAIATSSLGTYTLYASAGYSFLTLVQGNVDTGATAPRFEGQFISATTAAQKGVPSTYATNTVWISPAYPDSYVTLLNEMTAVTFQIFLAGNTSSTPDAIQYVRSLERPPNMAEMIANAPFIASLTGPALPPITLNPGTNGYFSPPVTGPFSLTWTVPTRGVPVTEVSLYGAASGIGFNDTASPNSNASQSSITCSPEPLGADPHCSSGSYVSSDQLTGITLHMFNADNGENLNSTVPRLLF